MFGMNRKNCNGQMSGCFHNGVAGFGCGGRRMGNGAGQRMRQGTGIGNNGKPQGLGLGCNQGYGTGFGRKYESLNNADKKAFLEKNIKSTKAHLSMMEKALSELN